MTCRISTCCKPLVFGYSSEGALTRWYNTEQCATAYCPGQTGNPVTRCVAAGTYFSTLSQLAANAIAQAAALAAATADLECSTGGNLNGLRWEMPMIQLNPVYGFGTCADPADQVATMAGAPATVYDVLIRFRGIVEVKGYLGGTVDAAAMASVTYNAGGGIATYTAGGLFSTGGIVDPTYNPGANEYSLIVSDPAQTYWLNCATIHSNWSQICHLIDYQETIPIATGATVTIRAQSKDNMQVANALFHSPSIPGYMQPMTVPGIVNLLPNTGQFIQMDVISVTPQ